ncbi:EAL and HDOD domain-containing protein [Paenibacillus sp. DYY-L-2]|uniref:EAL and HDOD domain-containing protein n=1 Tax=Paenibacillus sp. DYY-L-2 TaxID=3447013 RepID=UPI003F50C687
MDVYAARQPIFDSRLGVYGYELLYRKSMNNFYEGSDDNQATAELINNSFLVFQLSDLTDNKRAFINFSGEMLAKEIPLLLPKERIVVEILERVEPTEAVIEACRKLKDRGYVLALDDFAFDDKLSPLIELADMIKVDFSAVSLNKQSQLIQAYKEKYRITFLAEKIENRDEFLAARRLGYELFQGYFFSKPIVVHGKEIGIMQSSVIRIIDELNRDEPDYQHMAEIIEKDLGLTYKLLKAANSLFYGSRNRIHSIRQALVRMGTDELKKWMYLLMLKDIKNVHNKELIKTSLIRGKMMELLSLQLGMKPKQFDYFMVGLFSSADILLNKKMNDVVHELPLTKEVREALTRRSNKLGQVLDFILSLESADWSRADKFVLAGKIDYETVLSQYILAIKWANEFQE